MQAAAARLLAAAEQFDEALARLDVAVTLFGPDELADERRAARLQRARLRLRAGDPVSAETEAREVLAEDADEDGWLAGIILARALHAQGRTDEATEVLDQHHIDADYLDDENEDED
ncbi:tetratricopeptide repeat protein [Micromonospora chersina]|uniref:tetratricopeptide repeat protein n=1 Tax=Micromonospora chersina TaxID=47854 RepID=UPI0034560E9C